MLITGGASGLGSATVVMLLQKGASVTVADLQEDKLADLEKKHGASSRLLCVPCDVTQEEQVKNTVTRCIERFGRIDVAIASAGIAIPKPLLYKNKPMNLNIFKKTLQVNLYGTVNMAKHAAVAMSKQTAKDSGERGVIIFTSSIQASEAPAGGVSYGASKGAINGLTLPMARDLGRYGIRVTTIAPGPFLTPMTKPLGEAGVKAGEMATPLGRLGQADEYAHLACTVIENGYLNGVILKLDGGAKVGSM